MFLDTYLFWYCSHVRCEQIKSVRTMGKIIIDGKVTALPSVAGTFQTNDLWVLHIFKSPHFIVLQVSFILLKKKRKKRERFKISQICQQFLWVLKEPKNIISKNVIFLLMHRIFQISMTFQFSTIGFLIQNAFQYEPEAENCKSGEYNLG